MASIKLSVSPDFYRKVLKAARDCAQDAAPVVAQQAQGVLQKSDSLAPVESGKLRESSSVGTTTVTKTSAAVTAGYTHPAAGAIHEGWHWGTQTIRPPPHFLRKAAKASRAALKKAVAQSLANSIARLFPGK